MAFVLECTRVVLLTKDPSAIVSSPWLLARRDAPKGLPANLLVQLALLRFLRQRLELELAVIVLYLLHQSQLRTGSLAMPRLPNGARWLLFAPTLAGLEIRHYHLVKQQQRIEEARR